MTKYNNKKIEENKLKQTLIVIKNLLEQEKLDLNDLYQNFSSGKENYWALENAKINHIKNLETSMQKPYFARIDFIYEENGKREIIYIGKNGIYQDSDIIVTDWRAPISSLYYDSELGNSAYEAPEGIINGIMDLKRQYEIEEGILTDFFDVDLVSNDKLLQKYLNSNNDLRLKSIVSTIQKEQNSIIRKKMSDNIIVQGVAGSGKTTVALHRIAYLVYNYINVINQNQYLVIGPNPVFLKYIKSVLPELDVSEVFQCTFEEFASKYLDEEIIINSSFPKVNKSIGGKKTTDIDKFKCSLKYKDMIDTFLSIYYKSLTSKDLKMGEFEILNAKVIENMFFDINKRYNTDLKNSIEIVIDRLSRYIENNKEAISSKYSVYSHEIFKNAVDENTKKLLRSTFSKERIEIDKNCRTLLRKYFSKSKTKPTKLYKTFISSINDYNIYDYNYINELKKETSSNIKQNHYDFEDLSALIHIKNIVAPDKEYSKIRHVVVDEAQDFGEFNFNSLKETLPSATFSIFGDLAQSIYDYRGVENWEAVNEAMFEKKAEIIKFKKSFRTTAEIMGVADEIANSIGLENSELVVRRGEPVSFSKKNRNEIPNYIKEKIMEFRLKGYKTIAIISKTELLSSYINDGLKENELEVPNVSFKDDSSDEKFNVCTISNQLSKGLEFDAVIINDACEKIYSSSSSLDMKLLYVAVTRALHELDIIYSDDLSDPLNKYMQNQLILK